MQLDLPTDVAGSRCSLSWSNGFDSTLRPTQRSAIALGDEWIVFPEVASDVGHPVQNATRDVSAKFDILRSNSMLLK